jgi:hypothetical protein
VLIELTSPVIFLKDEVPARAESLLSKPHNCLIMEQRSNSMTPVVGVNE